MQLDKFLLTFYEIEQYWRLKQENNTYYIGRTASGKYLAFSFHFEHEANDYTYFNTYETARNYLRKRYNIKGRMKKVK